MRWLAIYIPLLPLLRHTLGQPTPDPAVIADEKNDVLLACPRAARQGIRMGMSRSAACALLPELVIHRHDPIGDRAALERLACWAGGFTSAISLVAEQGLLLDIAGSLRLFGGLPPLLAQVRRGLRHMGYPSSSMAVAPTAHGAWLLARAGERQPVQETAHLPTRIGALTVTVLGMDQRQQQRMTGVGIRTLNDLLALPRGGAIKRFGAGVMGQLDRALGNVADPLPLFVPPTSFSRRLSLPAEVHDTGTILFGLRRLLAELHGFLTARGEGVDEATLHLHHPGAGDTPVILTRLSLTRDDGHLFTLFRQHLERLTLDHPVEAITLSTADPHPLAACAMNLFGELPAGAEGQLLERIRARLGEQAVSGIHRVDEHRPERAWASRPDGKSTSAKADSLRPLWLLSSPQPLSEADGRPYRGGTLTLTTGPERIESGWWDGDDITRDYYLARHGGRGNGYWVFRDRQGDWFLHGVFA